MNKEITHYRYGANIKLSDIECGTAINEIFPSAEDLMLSSKVFNVFEEAVTSMNGTMQEIANSINGAVGSEKFKVMSEINPKFSGNATVSKDWLPIEVAKLWIVDGTKDSSTALEAVGLAQLLEVPEATSVLLN